MIANVAKSKQQPPTNQSVPFLPFVLWSGIVLNIWSLSDSSFLWELTFLRRLYEYVIGFYFVLLFTAAGPGVHQRGLCLCHFITTFMEYMQRDIHSTSSRDKNLKMVNKMLWDLASSVFPIKVLISCWHHCKGVVQGPGTLSLSLSWRSFQVGSYSSDRTC